MNKKQLIIAAMATVLTVGAANATTGSNITGFTTNSGAQTFSISPEKFNGSVGYRAYDNFVLNEADKANLIFHRSDKDQALDTFINLVGGSQKATINGILNTVDKNGAFTPGHAVFVTKNGMVVGDNGVMNVGRLSVITPTATKYSALKSNYDNFEEADVRALNQVSQLKHLGANGSGADGNDIDVKGYIYARNGVDLPGYDVSVSGKVVNGLNYNGLINTVNASSASAPTDAAYLFNQLVKNDGSIKAANSYINSNGSLLFVNSANEATVTGNLVNLSTGGTVGTNGKTVNNVSVAVTSASNLDVSGKIAANGKLSLYNKDADLTLSNANLFNKGGELSVTNDGSELTITNSKIENTTGNVSIINNGSSNLTITGGSRNATAGTINIVNDAGGNASIDGTTTAGKNVRIINRGDSLTLSGTTTGGTDVSVRNFGNGGLTQNGTISAGGKGTDTAGKGLLVHNHAGALNINGTLNSEGNVAVMNETDTGKTAGALTTAQASTIQGKNIVAIKNKSNSAMTLNGTVKNTGDGTYKGTGSAVKHETSINNFGTTMTVNGTVNNKGNMGILNRGTGKMTLNADIDNEGKLKLANVANGNSTGDFEINNTIDNKTGNLSVYNEKGILDINGQVKNTGNGYLFVLSRNNSKGITTDVNSKLESTNGNVAVKHAGLATEGLSTDGTISAANGIVAINNLNGDASIGGTVTGKTVGIINRGTETKMNGTAKNLFINDDANITATNLNIRNGKNTGNMTVGGTITHTGRANIIANDGTLTLDGMIVNNGTTAVTKDSNGNVTNYGDMTYVIARDGSDGLVTTTKSDIDSSNGMVWIRNKGTNGLTHNGSVVSTNAQAELQNYKGNMTVNGELKGNKAIVINRGDALVVADTADLVNDNTKTYILQRGIQQGTSVPSKYTSTGVYKYQYKD